MPRTLYFRSMQEVALALELGFSFGSFFFNINIEPLWFATCCIYNVETKESCSGTVGSVVRTLALRIKRRGFKSATSQIFFRFIYVFKCDLHPVPNTNLSNHEDPRAWSLTNLDNVGFYTYMTTK